MVTRRVIFIQQGARPNYVYAEQLERPALLHSLATDAAWTPGSEGLTRLAARVLPRLLGPVGYRTVRGVPLSLNEAEHLGYAAIEAASRRRFS